MTTNTIDHGMPASMHRPTPAKSRMEAAPVPQPDPNAYRPSNSRGTTAYKKSKSATGSGVLVERDQVDDVEEFDEAEAPAKLKTFSKRVPARTASTKRIVTHPRN